MYRPRSPALAAAHLHTIVWTIVIGFVPVEYIRHVADNAEIARIILSCCHLVGIVSWCYISVHTWAGIPSTRVLDVYLAGRVVEAEETTRQYLKCHC